MDSRQALDRLTEQCARTFESESRILAFSDYLATFLQAPLQHGRIAAAYVRDCLEHWGTEHLEHPAGPVTRWSLFDAPWDHGRDRLVGQEHVQREFYQAVASFARQGRADKLIMLHGPNGSAKTTFCELVFRALEAYSRTPEGALYRFSWIFPTREAQGKRLGFADDRSPGGGRQDSHAFLGQDEIAAKLACEMKDPPVFLLPAEARRELLSRAGFEGLDRPEHRHLLEGELCAKCRTVFDGLFKLHRGSLVDVLRHVQVERFFVSQRYRRAAVRINPQSHVDASEVQVAADRSVAALPPALHDLNLFVPVGDLVDGNRGLIEYSDFLKRPLEMNKYLLTTTEKGTISLPTSIAHLDAVMVATSNETHLDEFKKTPIFTSFNARLDLVQVPYLLRISQEEEVHAVVLGSIGVRKHVAPHVAKIAATWAVLCRMRRPDPDAYDAELRQAVRDLTPLEKARLYDDGDAPARLSAEMRSRLRAALPQMLEEYRDVVHYEGRYGPSARELRGAIMDCRYDQESPCVSPVSLLRQLRRLVRDKTVHEFLRVEPDNGYHDAEALVEVARDVYLELIEGEVRDSMQLVQPDEYRKVFERYVLHVNALRSREKVRNPVTGKMEDPDHQLVGEVESVIAGDTQPEPFREALIGRIGAWRVDHPDDALDHAGLFPEAVRALQEDYYERNVRTIEAVRDNMVRFGTEDLDDLDAELRRRVVDTMETMVDRYGHCASCAKEAVGFLSRYQARPSE